MCLNCAAIAEPFFPFSDPEPFFYLFQSLTATLLKIIHSGQYRRLVLLVSYPDPIAILAFSPPVKEQGVCATKSFHTRPEKNEKCQLWKVLNERGIHAKDRSIACFVHRACYEFDTHYTTYKIVFL